MRDYMPSGISPDRGWDERIRLDCMQKASVPNKISEQERQLAHSNGECSMTKKQFLLGIIFILYISFCFSKDYTKTVFKDVFPKDSPTYQFDVRNPLLKNELYVTDISALKNRILRTTQEEYTLSEDGHTYYSDSDIRSVVYEYYIFDADGHISDTYIINLNETGWYPCWYHTVYDCNKHVYTVTKNSTSNTTENSVESMPFLIKQESNSVNLYDANGEPAYEFSQNRMVQYRQYAGLVERLEYAYTGDSATCTDWWDKRMTAVRDYQYGILVKEYRPIPDGEFVRLCTSAKGTGLRQTSETRSGKKKAYPDQYTERRRNAAGFLEYELVRPVKDGDPGDYSISKAEIIDGPDEILQKYFVDK